MLGDADKMQNISQMPFQVVLIPSGGARCDSVRTSLSARCISHIQSTYHIPQWIFLVLTVRWSALTPNYVSANERFSNLTLHYNFYRVCINKQFCRHRLVGMKRTRRMRDKVLDGGLAKFQAMCWCCVVFSYLRGCWTQSVAHGKSSQTILD